MRLTTREWGLQGPIVLLVHGIMSDSRTWRLVGPALADRGFHAIAVDLRGHGTSARAADYSPAAYAADLVETMSAFDHPALAIGHSLGALALRYAVAEIAPARAVYVDPAWSFPPLEQGFDPTVFARFADTATAESIAAVRPRWAAEDVAVELATLACWDRETAAALRTVAGISAVPTRADIPSLVLLADPSSMLTPDETALLRTRGFTVRVVPGAGHTVHRDDLPGFLAALEL